MPGWRRRGSVPGHALGDGYAHVCANHSKLLDFGHVLRGSGAPRRFLRTKCELVANRCRVCGPLRFQGIAPPLSARLCLQHVTGPFLCRAGGGRNLGEWVCECGCGCGCGGGKEGMIRGTELPGNLPHGGTASPPASSSWPPPPPPETRFFPSGSPGSHKENGIIQEDRRRLRDGRPPGAVRDERGGVTRLRVKKSHVLLKWAACRQT